MLKSSVGPKWSMSLSDVVAVLLIENYEMNFIGPSELMFPSLEFPVAHLCTIRINTYS